MKGIALPVTCGMYPFHFSMAVSCASIRRSSTSSGVTFSFCCLSDSASTRAQDIPDLLPYLLTLGDDFDRGVTGR